MRYDFLWPVITIYYQSITELLPKYDQFMTFAGAEVGMFGGVDFL